MIHYNLSIYYEIILDKTFLALYLFFCISCNKNRYNSFWILFMDSIPLQLQIDGTFLGNKAVPTGLRKREKGDRIILSCPPCRGTGAYAWR
jgi:hypothetical protein